MKYDAARFPEIFHDRDASFSGLKTFIGGNDISGIIDSCLGCDGRPHTAVWVMMVDHTLLSGL